jgi:hypothetical protein
MDSKMNERIKKLAKKSGATLNEGFDGNKAFVYGITMSPEELEKFAELIVGECCDIVGDYYGQDKKSGPGYTMICEIKEHFGVEE